MVRTAALFLKKLRLHNDACMMEASFEIMVIAQCHHLQIVLQLVGKIGSQMLIDLLIVLQLKERKN